MYIRLLNLANRLRSSLWLIPGVMCVLAFLLVLAAGVLDHWYALWLHRHWPQWLIYSGDLDGARMILSTVAGSMITVAGVTFSVTVVALSMASSQFGPRLLLGFMRDRGNQIVFGTFISTFLYCLLALGNGDPEQDVLPVVSVTLGVIMAFFSIWVLIYFIHHASSTMRAEHVVVTVAQDVMSAVQRLQCSDKEHHAQQTLLPEQAEGLNWEDNTFAITAPRSGYVQAIDYAELIRLAESYQTVIRLLYRPGHFVMQGEPMAHAQPVEESEGLGAKASQAMLIGRQRTDEQDTEYGIHQLVEVAVRSLSPGINDPYTAISCIEWLGAALHAIADQSIYGAYRGHKQQDEINLRLIANPVTYAGLLDSAFDQIRQNAYNSPAVSIRLMEVLAVLAAKVSLTERRQALRVQADLLWEGCKSAGMQAEDEQDLQARYDKVIAALQDNR